MRLWRLAYQRGVGSQIGIKKENKNLNHHSADSTVKFTAIDVLKFKLSRGSNHLCRLGECNKAITSAAEQKS